MSDKNPFVLNTAGLVTASSFSANMLPKPEPQKSYRYIKIETVKNGYLVHAAEHDHPMNMVCNQFVFRSAVELGKWVEKHAGYYEE